METMGYKQGLTDGHIKQIIRRKMTQKYVPSKKVYDRKKVNKVW